MRSLVLVLLASFAAAQPLPYSFRKSADSKTPDAVDASSLQEDLEFLANQVHQQKVTTTGLVVNGVVTTVTGSPPLCSSGGNAPNITFCGTIPESKVVNLVSDLSNINTAITTNQATFNAYVATTSVVVDALGRSTNTFNIWQSTTSPVVFTLGTSTAALLADLYNVGAATVTIAASTTSAAAVAAAATALKVSKAGDTMTGGLRMSASSVTVDNDGFGQSALIAADSATFVDAFGHSVFVGNKGITVTGSSANTGLDNQFALTVTTQVRIVDNTAYSLISKGGSRWGCATLGPTCGVGLIGSDGRIPGINLTYFASVDGSSLSNVISTAGADGRYLQLTAGAGDPLVGDLVISGVNSSFGYQSLLFKNARSQKDDPIGEVEWVQQGTGHARIIDLGDNDTVYYAGETLMGADTTAGTAYRGIHFTASAAQPYDLFVSSYGRVGVSTGTPQYPLDVNGNALFRANVAIGTNTVTTAALSVVGVFASSTPIPSVTCTAGTPTMTAGSGTEFGSFAAGTLATGCTVTFATAFPTARVFCVCQASANLVVWASATSATAVTCTSGSAMTGDTITYTCRGQP